MKGENVGPKNASIVQPLHLVQLHTPPTDYLYDLYDLCDLCDLFPHHDVDVSRPIDLLPVLYDLTHDVAHVSWVGFVLFNSCTTSHNGK